MQNLPLSFYLNIPEYLKSSRLRSRARQLTETCGSSTEPLDVLTAVKNERKFSLMQKKTEILRFLDLIKRLKPRTVCDIGSSGGGTLRLFSHFAADDAKILSLDIANYPRRRFAYPKLARDGQQLTVYQGSSYAPQTLEFVKTWLGGEPIDLLFIDGDHNYDGVKQDFDLYSPLVRKGGIIAFHDVVEDYKTRFGKETPAWVGDVPRLWRELKPRFPKAYELIQDPEQDGFGIGVIEVL